MDNEQTWEAEHQRRALEELGLADEFGIYGCDAIEVVAEALLVTRKGRDLARQLVAQRDRDMRSLVAERDQLQAEIARLRAEITRYRERLIKREKHLVGVFAFVEKSPAGRVIGATWLRMRRALDTELLARAEQEVEAANEYSARAAELDRAMTIHYIDGYAPDGCVLCQAAQGQGETQ